MDTTAPGGTAPGAPDPWATRRRRAEKAEAQSLRQIPSARTIARLLTISRDTLSKSETITVAAIEDQIPLLVEAREKDERRRGRAHGTHTDGDSQTGLVSVNNTYLAAKNPWLQRQFHGKLQLSNLPFIVGRGPVAREGLPPLQPDLKLEDTVPFRRSGYRAITS